MNNSRQDLYSKSKQFLLDAIPGLMQMDVIEGLSAIDVAALDLEFPAISFNPWQWFQVAKHIQSTACQP